MEYQNIIFEQSEGIAILSFNRPEQMNPMDKVTMREMRTAMAEIEADEAIRSIIITGRGRAFSAGGDMKGYLSLFKDGAAFSRFVQDCTGTFAAIEESAKPVIAAVNGYCLAGGLELMVACDVVFASETAKIGDGHVKFGQLSGGGGAQRLARIVGPFRAKELLLSGDLLPAVEAQRIGLVNKVFPPDRLMPEAIAFCKKVNEHSPLGIKLCKQLVNLGMQTDLRSAIELEKALNHHYSTASHDAYEGAVAFSEKRKPNFTGK